MLNFEVVVQEKTVEAEGICSFTLSAAGNQALPSYTAGAHIDVEVLPGLVRQYSLCGDQANRPSWRIAVLREPNSRGGSRSMHDSVHVGSRLRVSAPKNHFKLGDASHYVLFAGGIGITPILAMANQLACAGKSFELHYCVRSRDKLAFQRELEESQFARQCAFYIGDAQTQSRSDVPGILVAAPAGSHLYVCGPKGFMDHVLDAARWQGWHSDRLHQEHFAGETSKVSGNSEFDVRLAISGRVFKVLADQSVLEVLLASGVNIPYACESGVCGTCITRVVEGTPDHRDTYLTAEERAANDQFTPCCSRAKSAVLTIDL